MSRLLGHLKPVGHPDRQLSGCRSKRSAGTDERLLNNPGVAIEARDAASFSQSFLRVRVAYDNWYAFTDLPVRARATPSIAPNMQAGEDHTVTFRPRRGHF